MAQPNQPTAISLAIKGLYLNPSTFGNNVPKGALTVADNVVIDRPSVVETRRGFTNTFSTVSTGVNSLFQFGDYLVMHGTNNKMYLVNFDGTTAAYSGTYSVPDSTVSDSKIRSIEVNKNFYFITDSGTYRLDNVADEPRLAGAPPGLSGYGSTTGTTGFMSNNVNVAYRVVFGYKDVNQQLVLGAPSSRIIVSNTSGTTANVNVTFQQPQEVQLNPTQFFFQVYRSHQSANTSTEPDDEMSLVYEEQCPAGATVTILDETDDSLVGAYLYTNQGQDGILQANYRPPFAMDICTFKQYAFFSNTRTAHSSDLTLISAGIAGNPNSMQVGDTVTFTATEFGGASFTLTAISGINNPALGQFQLSSTGNIGYDIQTTAQNIAYVANAYAPNTFLSAYYISTGSDLPGQMNFSRTDLNVNPFIITGSRTTCFEQVMPLTSINDVKPNRIYYSKFNQPDAVPLVNYLDVGSANQPIIRAMPLRDGIMILKTDGVYRVSNAAPPFVVTPIDLTINIIAANTAVQLENTIYFLSNQGVVSLSDSSSTLISFDLDQTIFQNSNPILFPNLAKVAYGLAYQTGRKYILGMPKVGTDTEATQQYVYNYKTEVWTKWYCPSTCGIINTTDDRLYLGGQVGSAPGIGNAYIYQERKTATLQDYADNQYTTNITSVNIPGKTIIIANPSLPTGVTLQPGWTVVQNTSTSSSSAKIVSVSSDPSFTTLVLDTIQNWVIGNVTIFTPIGTQVQTIQIDCQNPGMNKQFSEIIYIFTEQGFTKLTANISSNTTSSPTTDYLVPSTTGGWGIDPWGSAWGGTPAGQGKIRRYVPQAVQRAGWLYVNLSNNEAFTKFGFSGLELPFKNTSTRQF